MKGFLLEIEKKKYWLLLFGLFIGAAFDIFFYNKTLGINYPIFIIFILIGTLFAFWKKYGELNNRAWVWALPILTLSITFFLYSNQILKIFNFIIIIYLLIMLISLVSKTNRSDWADIRFLVDFFRRLFVPLIYIHVPFITFFRMTDKGNKDEKMILPRIAIGLLVSIPVLAIIIWLLSSADMIFKDLFTNISIPKIIKHFFVILAITVYTICFYWSIFKEFDGENNSVYKSMNWKRFLDPVIIMTVLFLLNLVYAVFSVIQFTYLFGGKSFLLPSEFTYAEYARRGFFELLVVAVINFVIIIITVSFIRTENIKLYIANKVLLTLVACFTFVMLVSAFYRMLVYEQAYGFTYLRIFVQAFMVLLFFLFIINIIFIWYSKLPIIKTYFITAIVAYTILNFANVDMIIARNNINRYFNTGQVDMEYLEGLSYEAIPEMTRIIEDNDLGGEVLECFKDKKVELNEQDVWQSFNYSRARASKIIEKYLK
jgi:hypothetical protein